MHRRHPLPRLWLMTDERQGDGLFAALERLPRGSGLVFRHYGLPAPERRRLFRKVKRIADRKGLFLLLAGPANVARAWGADGSHGPPEGRAAQGLFRSASAHNLPEIRAAERGGADCIFLSPVFPTRSHPGGRPLGKLRFGLLSQQTRKPVIALGGMNPARAHRLGGFGFHGWAAIDAWGE